MNHGLILKRVQRVLQFNQKSWLQKYIDLNTNYSKKAKNEFEKDFFKLMINSVYGKTMEDKRILRDIELVTTEKRRSILVSKPNYHTTKHFSEDLLAIEMKKTKKVKSKSLYLGQIILDISKTC